MQYLFVWIVLIPIIAFYAIVIILHFIKTYDPDLYVDVLFSLLAAVRRKKTEKFFKSQSNAARKLYAFGKQIGAEITIANVGGKYGAIVFFTKKSAYIFLDNSYLYVRANGLLEMSLAHELGHCLARREPLIEFCEQKKIVCELIREKMAWDASFELFKKLNITVDEEMFWNRARACFATHIRVFVPKDCDAIPKLYCSRTLELFPSPIFSKEMSDEEIRKYIFEIPEENIIKSD